MGKYTTVREGTLPMTDSVFRNKTSALFFHSSLHSNAVLNSSFPHAVHCPTAMLTQPQCKPDAEQEEAGKLFYFLVGSIS